MEARLLLHKPIERSRGGKIFIGVVFGLVAYGIYRLVSPLWLWRASVALVLIASI